MTLHSCTKPGSNSCEQANCTSSDEKNGFCDKQGCDANPFRLGYGVIFGPNQTFLIDTAKPFSVVTQFITEDGTSSSDLKEIKRYYV